MHRSGDIPSKAKTKFQTKLPGDKLAEETVNRRNCLYVEIAWYRNRGTFQNRGKRQRAVPPSRFNEGTSHSRRSEIVLRLTGFIFRLQIYDRIEAIKNTFSTA